MDGCYENALHSRDGNRCIVSVLCYSNVLQFMHVSVGQELVSSFRLFRIHSSFLQMMGTYITFFVGVATGFT